MSQEGSDLFEVMDSALKRQREAGGGHPKSDSRKQAAASAADQGPAAPAPPAAAPAEPPPGRATITQRFNRLPDMARTAPAPGSLSPSQVLRGTVFSGGHLKTGGETAAPAAAPAAPPTAAQPAAPPPPPPTPKIGSGRMVGVQPLAAGVIKTGRPSGMLGALRPSVALPEPVAPAPPPPPPTPPPASVALPAPASGVYRTATGFHAPVAQPSTHGFFVRTAWAVTAVLAVTVGLMLAFWMGYRAGDKVRVRSVPGGQAPAPKPPVVGTNLKPVSGLEGAPLTPVTGLAPSPAPKYTVKIRNFWPQDRAVAERLAADLRKRGGDFALTRVITRGAPGSETLVVCVGHFDLRTDPQAERLRRAVLALPEQYRRDPAIIQE